MRSQIVRNCRNPHKGLRINTSARALHSSHRSCFESYIPPKELTERQQLLLEGRHPNPRKGEVSALLRKLRYHGRHEEAELVFKQYEYFYQEIHNGDPSHEEAMITLKNLTPTDFE